MESIFQFRNEGARPALNRIRLIDQARATKCAEIDELFKKIAMVGIKVPNVGNLVVEKKYSEQIDSIRKSLTGKKDKALPEGCESGSLYDTIKAENEYLAKLRVYINEILVLIKQKIGELSALHYFLTADELRELGF